MESSFVYLDYAAATPLDERVYAAMLPYLTESYANPSALYERAEKSRHEIEKSRAKISRILQCNSRDVIFTSSGTEANNLALFGIAEHHRQSGASRTGHIITTKIEHSSVLEPARELERRGFAVTYLDVDAEGFVAVDDVAHAVRDDTMLVSIIYANNEIGIIQNIAEIGRVLSAYPKIVFHTDACQAANYLTLDMQELNVDAMTLNSSKIYGPKGVGALIIKDTISIAPRLFGGGQERGKRSGTENVAGIIGFAAALEMTQEIREEESARLSLLRDNAIHALLTKIPQSRLNGSAAVRLPNNINLSFEGVEGEALFVALHDKKIEVSAGSSCSEARPGPSHVIQALGVPEAWANSTLRVTLGRGTTEKDVQYLIEELPGIIEQIREDSPFV